MSIDLYSFPLTLEKQRLGGASKNGKRIILTLVWLALDRAPGGSAGSFPLFLFPPRSRRTEELWYAQRVEDPLRVSVVSVGNSTYCLEKKKVSATVLFYPILTGAPTATVVRPFVVVLAFL